MSYFIMYLYSYSISIKYVCCCVIIFEQIFSNFMKHFKGNIFHKGKCIVSILVKSLGETIADKSFVI